MNAPKNNHLTQPYKEDYICMMTGVHDDKATSTVPTIALVQVETVAKSIHEEIHEGIGSAVKDTNEKQGPDNDYEENTKVLQV